MEHWLEILMNGLDPETRKTIEQGGELARFPRAERDEIQQSTTRRPFPVDKQGSKSLGDAIDDENKR